jgi:phosphoribosylformylglycinamidine synthase
MGASEYYAHLGHVGNKVPRVLFGEAAERYRGVHSAIEQGLVKSCHDCSDGGLAVALAEMAFSGETGLDINLGEVPVRGELVPEAILFSETASRLLVEMAPDDAPAFETIMAGTSFARIGTTTARGMLTIDLEGQEIISMDLDLLKGAWQETLKEL